MKWKRVVTATIDFIAPIICVIIFDSIKMIGNVSYTI